MRPSTGAGFAAVCAELDGRRHITLGLDRIRALLTALGEPQRALRVAQVVGTNGKGTTAVALAAALEGEGPKTGTYLSPHLFSYTERVMLRGEYVAEARFAEAMGKAITVADDNGIPASQFELLTAGAVRLFADEGLEYAVLEAGLGARFDATTAAEPEAVVLTNVGLDHTEFLGDTVEDIAREKLASVPADGLLVLGTADPRVVALARARCAEAGARLVEAVAPDASAPQPHGTAPYAARNALLGVRAAEELLGRRLSDGRRAGAVAATVGALPGRFERREHRGVEVVLDGGHNADGVQAALEAVRGVYGGVPLVVVFGALRDKEIGSMLSGLRREARALVLTGAGTGRAADPGWISCEHDPRDQDGRRAEVVGDAVEALEVAVERAGKMRGMVLVTGSLYTCAAVSGAFVGG